LKAGDFFEMLNKLLIVIFCAILSGNFVFAERKQYPDLLDIRNSITKTDEVERSFFSDLGAWHAYALPKEKADYGSFIGPLVMDLSGEWLANSFAKLTISENGTPIDLSAAKFSAHYFPGLLQQILETSDLDIRQSLIFVSNREALIETKITNRSAKTQNLEVSFKGELLLEKTTLKQSENRLTISFPDPEKSFLVDFIYPQPLSLQIDNRTYKAVYPEIRLKPQQTISLIQSQKYYLQKSELSENSRAQNFAAEQKKNETRWNGYLNKYLAKAPKLDSAKSKLAVKSIVTLLTNWRSAAKDLRHDGVFPSASYQGFYGFWSWDSWKQAVALVKFEPELAKSNLRSMFDYQNEAGMVADCIYTDKKENNWRDTKPPLSAWAVWKIYEQTHDRKFVSEILPKLLKYHDWWYQNRDHDQNGLCEYGSTDNTKIAAKWESGMDNAVRFDNLTMLKNNDTAWSIDQESVDLNSYLYAEKLYLAKLAIIMNKKAIAAQLRMGAAQLKTKINERFYSESKGYFFDYNFPTKSLIAIEGTEGWIPLWAGIASNKQAAKVVEIMRNERKFNTKIPLPTFTADHPKFDPLKGYWRGPVWLDQFNFGIVGLQNYGYQIDAELLKNKLWNNAEGLLTNGEIRENYHPISGKGLNALNFSWSAAHILLMLKNE
jgi:putative isomerase